MWVRKQACFRWQSGVGTFLDVLNADDVAQVIQSTSFAQKIGNVILPSSNKIPCENWYAETVIMLDEQCHAFAVLFFCPSPPTFATTSLMSPRPLRTHISLYPYPSFLLISFSLS